MSKTQMAALDSEIAELEAQFGKTTESDKSDDTLTTQEDDQDTDTEDEVDDDSQDGEDTFPDSLTDSLDGNSSEDDETDEKPQKKKYTDWKQRYKSLRSYHDATIYDLRQELSGVKSALIEMQKVRSALTEQLSVLNDKSSNNSFGLSEEEQEVLGEEAVEAIRKATSHAMNPLKSELEAERQLRLKQDEDYNRKLQEDNKQLFIRRFKAIVPNYEKIDKDASFLSFMRGLDTASGYDRTTLFKRAVNNGDVARAAGFYTEYLHNSKSPLEKKLTPTGETNSANVAPKNKETITRAFIEKFYDDVIKGRYAGKASLQKEIEAKIDQAAIEGRIRN